MPPAQRPRLRPYLCIARGATVFGVAVAALASCQRFDRTWPPPATRADDVPPQGRAVDDLTVRAAPSSPVAAPRAPRERAPR
jgi:hypothetical protein